MTSPLKKRLSLMASCRGAFLGVAVLSGLINLLYLSGSIFMMEVYDRVLPSQSIPTLVGLSVIIVVLYLFQGLFDALRGRIMARVGAAIDEDLSQQIFQGQLKAPLKGKVDGDGQQPLRDLDQLRAFLAGGGPSALFDLPWMPLYLFICFAFHPWIGLAALGGACLLVVITLLTEVMTKEASKAAVGAALVRNGISEGARRNAEVVQAMGMARRIGVRWGDANASYLSHQQRTSDVAGGFGAMSKVLRMLLQSMVLAIGAYLVIDGQATGGIMIASSILTSRAMAPVELAIGNWKGFVSARQGWRRLKTLLEANAQTDEPLKLPAPRSILSIENAGSGAPGGQRFSVQDVSFELKAGSGLGIIGPSASGKSSLARMIVGVWPTWRGKVRFDGAAVEQWLPEDLGQHIGYLPQDVELFAGTVAQNIARFDPEPKAEAIIAAARAANVHEMILQLPDGYETQVGEAGAALSGGQRQRLALARALYGDPFLVVLDEPNSNLDNEGEQALTAAIMGIRARGGVVVVIAHRPSALAGVDLVLVMGEGRMQSFGPKDEVLSKVLRPVPAPQVAEPRVATATALKAV
ncbi:type I secretion system permease/ATPase [Microvirga sp. BT688]|uniref:type I secretion system permease/ATPase n=1 Tax=Microvirga sp. TaxID=1873136 RepID=UPI0016853B7C|nr:type I secretion system permease/ATPase [Microvirga sp.]MBD2748006.1 type I secretion system permease/ATPase [Microvirga sp.]MBD2748013.1 type I secretion system permease/ATPase [Microvirga sp.]